MSVTTPPAIEQLPAAGRWTIDASHSSVEFVVRHMVVAKTKGRFGRFIGTITIDGADPLRSSVVAEIETASVDTRDQKRDEHLRSADFFDAATYPVIGFRSTKIAAKGRDHQVEGELTIKDVTRPVVLDLEFNGQSADPWGGTRAGFTATTAVDRKDFGLAWNLALEAGGVLVGDTIKIVLEIEAVLA